MKELQITVLLFSLLACRNPEFASAPTPSAATNAVAAANESSTWDPVRNQEAKPRENEGMVRAK